MNTSPAYVVWRGFIRSRSQTHVFDGVTER